MWGAERRGEDGAGGGVIGSKEFVDKVYRQFKHHFLTNREKRPKPIKGLDGVYSLKRLPDS